MKVPKTLASKVEMYGSAIAAIAQSDIKPFQKGSCSATPKFSITCSKSSGLLEASGMKNAKKIG